MNTQAKGCIRLFSIAGITVFLHWSWLVVAVIELSVRKNDYPSPGWNVLEYLALFGIVLLHEMGHAFACRSVGGKADRIMLWPLGGVAYVQPPPRPGALLWSIAAGPLVNVMLVPVTIALYLLVQLIALPAPLVPAQRLFLAVAVINMGLLIFNVLPIYPLDGGQMLHALLWFVMGRARSLLVCSVIGLVGAGGLILLALLQPGGGGGWLIVVALFLGLQAVAGFRRARELAVLEPAVEHLQRAAASVQQGDGVGALAECDQTLDLLPEGHLARAEVHSIRALALVQMGRHGEAIAALDDAIQLAPRQPALRLNRGLMLARQGQYAQAVEDYQQALQLAPTFATALNNLAWLLATAADADFRNGALAVELAQRACKLSGGKEPSHLGTLAAAYAEVGDFEAAVHWQKKALESPAYCEQHGPTAWDRVRLYEAGMPYRDQPGG
jgi:Zn-dependent protease/Flp pilus assembly protein TadD